VCKILGPTIRPGAIHYVISEIQPFNIMHLLSHNVQCYMAALLNEPKRLKAYYELLYWHLLGRTEWIGGRERRGTTDDWSQDQNLKMGSP
jgi:hypothetical protein